VIPLYRYQLDEDTGEISCTAIEDYHITHPSKYMPKRVHYCYVTKGIRHDIHGENIDKFVNWQVYSFSDNEENVRDIMLSNLRMRYKKALMDTKRFATVIDKLGGFGDEKDRDILSD
jgi:hypothetical protein